MDNNFLIELPVTTLEKGTFKKCPLIIGFNKDEGTSIIFGTVAAYLNTNGPQAPFITKETFDRELKNNLGYFSNFYINDVIEDSIKQEYVDWSNSDNPEADYFDTWNRAIGDHFYSCPAILETRYQAMAAEHDIYQYFFTHVPSISIYTSELFNPGWLGAGHAEDLHFVFGYPFDPSPYYDFHKYSNEKAELSHQLITYWTNFAKTG